MTDGQKVLKAKSKGKGRFLRELKQNKILFIMLIPALLYFFINNYLPIIGIYFAFTRFSFSGGLFGSPFVGMENFRFLWESGKLSMLTINTVGYNIAFIFTSNFMQILCAILLSRIGNKYFKKTTQSIMFLPYFVSYVILNVIVYNLFNYDVGFINGVLRSMGSAPFDAYNNPGIWRFLMVIFYLWKQIGYGTVIYLATITSISPELYEAAEIDGAGGFAKFRKITIPMMTPIIFYNFVMAIIGSMQTFTQSYIMTDGGPSNASLFYSLLVYRTAFKQSQMGYSAAMSWILFLIIAALTAFVFKTSDNWVIYENGD